MNDLLTHGGLSAASFLHTDPKSNLKYTSCGKVNLKTRDGKNVIGYIVDEHPENEQLKIKLHELEDPETGRDKVIKLKRSAFNREHCNYMMIGDEHLEGGIGPVGQVETFPMSQIWPTRIKINKTTGASSIICNIHTYNDEPIVGHNDDDEDNTGEFKLMM